METIAQHYKIPTNLSIAAARLAEMMPRAGYVHREPAGEQGKEVRWVVTLTLDQRKQVEVVSLVMFTLDRQQEDEAVYLTLRPVSYLTTCGPWQVRVEPERMQWTHAGVCITLGEGMDVAVAWGDRGDTRQKRALWAVRARLPRLELPSDLWAWRLVCRLVAMTPTETIAAWWTLRMEEVAELLEQQVVALQRAITEQKTPPAAVTSASEPEGGVARTGAQGLRKPEREAPLEQWFDYYHKCKQAGERITLGDIARDTTYAAGHIRKKHAMYVKAHGLGTKKGTKRGTK